MKERIKTYKELAIEFKNTRSETAYNQLYKKMYGGLKKFVFNILKDPDLTDDVVSNTLTKLYTRIDEYDENYQITTWAYTIAKNEAFVLLKKSVKTDSIEHLNENIGFDVEDDCYENGFEDIKTEDDLMEDERILDEQMKLIKDEVLALPSIYKDFVYLRLYKNTSYNDILEIMKKKEPNINLGTVKNRIHLGKEKIKKNLIDNPYFKNINIETCI